MLQRPVLCLMDGLVMLWLACEVLPIQVTSVCQMHSILDCSGCGQAIHGLQDTRIPFQQALCCLSRAGKQCSGVDLLHRSQAQAQVPQ